MPKRSGEAASPVRLEVFERYRSLLFSIAYDIVGVREEAERLVQRVRVSWLSATRSELATARASLVMDIATRSLEHLQDPEERSDSSSGAPNDQPGRDSGSVVSPTRSSSRFALTVLDGLTPVERSVFLLRKIFKCNYSEISRMVGQDEAECRRIVHRARRIITKSARSGMP